MQGQDFIDALRTEIEQVESDLATQALQIAQAPADDPGLLEAIEAYANQVERIAQSAELLGMKGFQEFCNGINNNLLVLAGQDADGRAQAALFLVGWVPLAVEYLKAPGDFANAEHLVMHLVTAPQPIAEEDGMTLMEQLVTPPDFSALLGDEEAPSRPTQAAPEAVSLELPADLDPSLYEGFLQEAPQHAGELSMLIDTLAAGQGTPAQMASAKRLAHTFKGSASIIGIRGITALGHHTEDILEYLQEHPQNLPPGLASTLIDAAGCLEQMVYYLMGMEEEPAQAQAVLQAVLDWANRIDRGELEDVSLPVPPAPESAVEELLAKTGKIPTLDEWPELAAPPAEMREQVKERKVAAQPQQAPDQSLRVPVKTVDDLFRLVGELSINVGQLQERLKLALQRSRNLLTQNLAVQRRLFELENIVDIRGVAMLQGRQGRFGSADFDPLEMDQYSELHSTVRALTEETADARELGSAVEEEVTQLSSLITQQDRINRDLQYLTMATRMTPINTIISRLQRNVRQTCQTIGKKAELVVEGGDILVDGDVLNRLSDPFLHMLRNAVDHGIETPEERIQSGKPETGTIYLLFTRQGQSVVVRCYDDGRGLNYPAIREKAIHAGLIQADQKVAENELARLILLPGFSTKSKVTEVSGRGVGMDVVRDRILSMNGSIDIRSETGKGTTIDLRFQASLIVTHALLVRAGGQMYALPSFNIDQAIAPGSAEFTRVGDELNVVVGQAVYPAHALTALVGSRTSDLTEDNLRQKAVVIMRIEQNRVGIILDQLVESRDLIVKNMGKFVSRLKGVAGASILGDGTVAPVLDVPELLRTPVQTVFMTSEESTDAMSAARGAARVLIVDDSLTVRKTLEELIADNGYEARLARDGLEAIDIMRAFAPDVVLTDLEMPNMNGLELTSRLRANPQTQGLPIIMITSRSMDKHKDQARMAGVTVFLTKPYSDAELLQHIRSLIGKQLSAASGQN